jgi:hypothetical protein
MVIPIMNFDHWSVCCTKRMGCPPPPLYECEGVDTRATFRWVSFVRVYSYGVWVTMGYRNNGLEMSWLIEWFTITSISHELTEGLRLFILNVRKMSAADINVSVALSKIRFKIWH